MRLNLGCGRDVRQGYVNVDLFPPADQIVDLSRTPWPWTDSSADEVMMLDFLEHFPYAKTDEILTECWRVLRPDGELVVQVPDFTHCAKALIHNEVGDPNGDDYTFMCNRCACIMRGHQGSCPGCGQSRKSIEFAAVSRLFGGQDRPGNWHFTTFTTVTLGRKLEETGFCDVLNRSYEKNQNGETFYQNWNIRMTARKKGDLW